MKRICLLLPFVFAGCTPPATDKPNSATSAQPASTAIELKDVTYQGLDDIVAANKGKVVLIDVWATFCAPCIAKFPHFIETHEKFRDKGLVCISATTDEPENRDKALKFLKESKATCINVRFSEEVDKISKALYEKYPTFEQPVMFLFDKSGKKVKQYGSKVNFQELDAEIQKLLDVK